MWWAVDVMCVATFIFLATSGSALVVMACGWWLSARRREHLQCPVCAARMARDGNPYRACVPHTIERVR